MIIIEMLCLAPRGVAARPSDYALVGRFAQAQPDGLVLAWPASSIGATFLGTSLQVSIEDDEARQVGGESVHNVYDAFVDGCLTATLTVVPGVSLYLAADSLPPGVHTVWLRKRTEAMVGSSTFYAFVPGGDGATMLPAPLPRRRRLQVIGASNETGYGNLRTVGAAAMCTFSSATQNALTSFVGRAADLLDADLVDLAYSGRGLTRNWDGSTTGTMAELFRRTDPHVLASKDIAAPQVPDVIFVDLGGNDWAQGSPDQAAFVLAYHRLVAALRLQAPRAPILLALNPTMHGDARLELADCLQRVVDLARQGGDSNVQILGFEEYTGSTFGCDYHPDAALHATMALTLVAAVRRSLGW